MASRRSQHEYRPPRWLVVLVVSSFPVFAGWAVFFFLSGANGYYTFGFSAATLLSVIAVVEVLFARITLETDSIRVRGLFRSERIPIREIAEVRLDGGRTCLRMKSGEWRMLPEWLGANMSVRHRIASLLERGEEEKK